MTSTPDGTDRVRRTVGDAAPYVGNRACCATSALRMALLGAGARDVPEVGFLECLTLLPFGHLYLRDAGAFFFSPPAIDPHRGLTRALATLGWACEVTGADPTPEHAYDRLRSLPPPVLVGPLDMSRLTYQPDASALSGADHFAIILDATDDGVRACTTRAATRAPGFRATSSWRPGAPSASATRIRRARRARRSARSAMPFRAPR